MAQKVDLVMGAGGVRCVSYIGALLVLEERGYEIESVSTCSAGSMIGALLASGLSAKQVEELVLGFELTSLLGRRRLFGRMRRPYAEYSRLRVDEAFKELIQGDPTFADLKLNFSTIGVDLLGKRLLLYDKETHPKMKISEALSVAMAVPFLGPPHRRGERSVVDGALASSVPVWIPAARHAHRPIVALHSPDPSTPTTLDTIPGFLGAVIGAGIAARDHLALQQVSRARLVEIRVPQVPFNKFSIDRAERRFLIDEGRRAMETALQGAPLRDVSESAVDLQVPNIAGDSDDDRAEVRAVKTINHYYGEVYMGHNITAGDNSVINVDAHLKDVVFAIGSSNHIEAGAKSELQAELEAFREAVKQLGDEHRDVAGLLQSRLDEVIEHANKPKEERKRSLLELTGNGLVEAAKAVAEVVPMLLPVAKKIAALAVGLV